MKNFSKYFKLDTIDANQTLKPVIVITDTDDNILHTLAQDQDELFDINGDFIDIINCISKVSNIKVSNDYDSKTLKINRLRCTLYNYYDVNTKLSQYINTNILNKNIYLFYKSPTTNVINLQDLQNDYECGLIYVGEVSRITFDDNNIILTAEDKTQIKIGDKQVPYLSADKLPLEIKDNLLKEYKNQDISVPMTFGKVDKAFTLPYLETNNENVMNILLDNQPTAGNHKTAKIPKLLSSPTPTSQNYCLYVKKDDDYIILDHDANSAYEQNNQQSKIKLYTYNTGTANYLIPEIHEEVELEKQLWSVVGYTERLVDSVYALDGGITTLKYAEVDNLDDTEFINIESINDNGGYEKTWYRSEDSIKSTTDNFETGVNIYDTTYTNNPTEIGTGRWIILKLSKSIDNNLYNVQNATGTYGNTWLCSNWELYQSNIEGATPNNIILPAGADRTGFFVAPIAFDVWRDLINTGENNLTYEEYQAQLNLILLRTDEQIEEARESIESGNLSNLQNSPAPTINVYRDAPIYLKKNQYSYGGSNYWGEKNESGLDYIQGWWKIQGLHYGDGSITEGKRKDVSADVHDLIAVFEYFPPFWAGVNSYQQGLKMNNIGFLHSVIVDNLQEEEIFASITGRTNKLYTQEIEYTEPVEFDENVTFAEIISGPNLSVPAPSQLLDAFVEIATQTFNGVKESDIQLENMNPIFQSQLDTFFFGGTYTKKSDGGFRFYNLETYTGPQYLSSDDYLVNAESIFQEAFNNNDIDDSVMWLFYDLWKNYIWRVLASPLAMYDLIGVYSGGSSQNIYLDDDYFEPSIIAEYDLYGRNYTRLWNTSFLRAYGVKILEYLYQRDIEDDAGFLLIFESGSYFRNEDITNSVEEKMIGNRWNDYNIQSFDDWINNFYAYFDNLVYAVQKSIVENLPPLLNQSADQYIVNNYDNAITEHPILGGISYLENNTLSLENLKTQMNEFISNQVGGFDVQAFLNDGVIEKPSDIVMNILVNEMEYGKLLNNEFAGRDIIVPDYSKFDIDSINESRDIHNWKMGFSLSEKTNGKKLIEEILKESKSYPRFTSDGRFGLTNIKESYTYDDIDVIIDTNDIVKYSFSQTKREDIITSVKMFYRYDYGIKKYNFSLEKSINTLLPEYQFDNYNLLEIDGHKEMQLKYHTDETTVNNFANYVLLNNCNVHNECNIKLNLNYCELEVGDIIHLPLINNEKIFNVDYSVVDYVNGQPVYPLWIIMGTDLGVDSITIKAIQLHYLGTDGNHGFMMPEQDTYDIIGNTKNLNSVYVDYLGNPVPNSNYNPLATIDNNLEIPYYDLDGNGTIDVNDINILMQHINGNTELTQAQKNRIPDESIDIVALVKMVEIVLNE